MKNAKKWSATINLSLVLLLIFIPVFIAPASADDFDTPGITPLPVPDVSNLEVWNVQEPITVRNNNGGENTYDTHMAAYVEGYGVVRVPINTPTLATSEIMGSNVPPEIGAAIVNTRPVNRVLSDDDLVNNAGRIPVEFNPGLKNNPSLADIQFVGEYFGQHPEASPSSVMANSVFAYCASPEGMRGLGYELKTLTGTREDVDGSLTSFEYQVWFKTGSSGTKP